MSQLARMLMVGGLFMLGLGVLLWASDRLGFGLGKLPGDLLWKRNKTTVYFPLMSSLVVSVVLTVLLNLFLRRK